MPRKFSEVLEEARALPSGERAELIEQWIAGSAKRNTSGPPDDINHPQPDLFRLPIRTNHTPAPSP